MTKKPKRRKAAPEPRAEPRPRPRLYLVTPPLARSGDFAVALEAALAAAPVACVLVRFAATEPDDIRSILADIAPAATRHDAALVAAADPAIARAAGIDGVQARGAGPALEAAVKALKPDFIVGAGDIRARHDAMIAGESDIDYLMFGDPVPDGWTPPLADTLERVGWWADIFNIPCVGFVASLDDIPAMAAAGADFVAICDAIWTDPRGPGPAALAADQALKDTVLP